MTNRRQFLSGSGAALIGAAMVTKIQAASLPEAPMQASAATQPPLVPPNGRPYNPVVTLNGGRCVRMNSGVKELKPIAEPCVREIAPGMKANLWVYNASRRDRPLKLSKATACAVCYHKLPAHRRSTGTDSACPTEWTAWAE